MNQPTVDEVIAAYVRTRDEIAAETKEFEASIEKRKASQKAKEKWLQGEMDKLGVSSFKVAGVGTCFTKRTESVKVADFEQVFKFAVENDCRELLTEGVSKTVALEFMGEKRDKPLPPGLEYVAFVDVNVRRA